MPGEKGQGNMKSYRKTACMDLLLLPEATHPPKLLNPRLCHDACKSVTCMFPQHACLASGGGRLSFQEGGQGSAGEPHHRGVARARTRKLDCPHACMRGAHGGR